MGLRVAVVLDGKCSPSAERVVKSTQRASGGYVSRRTSGGEVAVVYFDGDGEAKGEVCTALNGSPSAPIQNC